jgi:hypothetical protein
VSASDADRTAKEFLADLAYDRLVKTQKFGLVCGYLSRLIFQRGQKRVIPHLHDERSLRYAKYDGQNSEGKAR